MLLIHHVCDLCSYQDDMNHGGVCLFSMSGSSLTRMWFRSEGDARINYYIQPSHAYFHREIL